MKKGRRSNVWIRAAIAVFIAITAIVSPQESKAHCQGCIEPNCMISEESLPSFHNGGSVLGHPTITSSSDHEREILFIWSGLFSCYRSWLVDHDSDLPITYYSNGVQAQSSCQALNAEFSQYFRGHILRGLMGMTEQLTSIGMQQVAMFGRMFDAKHQLETQRLLQEKQFEAHKDYQPSEDFCWFGTGAQSLASSEQYGKKNKRALNKVQMARQMGQAFTAGATNADGDKLARWQSFKENHCDPKDNRWTPEESDGLFYVCGSASNIRSRVNHDINYTHVIDGKRGLEVDFVSELQSSEDEQDVLALFNNIYGHDILSRQLRRNNLKQAKSQELYMLLRSVAAKRNVAQNTFHSIVALKAENPGRENFSGMIFENLGIPESEISDLAGDSASYYGLLEALSSKIYQNPAFYSNLYDKPANVQRKSVALKAIDLMLDRAMFESELRQEMALSVMLSSGQNEKLKTLGLQLDNRVKTTGGSR